MNKISFFGMNNPFSKDISPIKKEKENNTINPQIKTCQCEDCFELNTAENIYKNLDVYKEVRENEDLQKILKENHLPIKLNLKEIEEIKEGHCNFTKRIAVGIYKNLPPALKAEVNITDLKNGAMLHDIGKILIPAEILNKKGNLTPEEHKIMDLHSEIGYQLLKNSGLNDNVLTLIRYHHNGVENSQYRNNIGLMVLNLADKYSALTEDRVYRNAYSPKYALTILYKDVENGKVHPFLFNALVKSVSGQDFDNEKNKNTISDKKFENKV